MLFASTALILTAGSALGLAGTPVVDSRVSLRHGVADAAATFAGAPGPPSRPVWPAAGAPGAAREIAGARGGLVSFAAIGPHGRVVGFHENRRYVSASVVKAMLLVAELRRLRRGDMPLDAGTAGLLRAMITASDNDAADQIYYRVGDAGLNEVAERAGMARFDVSGHWGNAQVTAADLAGFMWRLDGLLDLPHGGFGSELLAGIVEYQRWGIPEVAPERARLRFKGGWRPTDLGQLVHQVARVDRRDQRYAVAVLTDAQPSMEHAIGTIKLISAELIRRDRPSRRRPSGGGSES